ncbi:hypothetical protein ACOSQ2_003264 [Xanthoceras sorbifolium]
MAHEKLAGGYLNMNFILYSESNRIAISKLAGETLPGEVAPVEEVTEVARPSPLPDRPAATGSIFVGWLALLGWWIGRVASPATYESPAVVLLALPAILHPIRLVQAGIIYTGTAQRYGQIRVAFLSAPRRCLLTPGTREDVINVNVVYPLACFLSALSHLLVPLKEIAASLPRLVTFNRTGLKVRIHSQCPTRSGLASLPVCKGWFASLFARESFPRSGDSVRDFLIYLEGFPTSIPPFHRKMIRRKDDKADLLVKTCGKQIK